MLPAASLDLENETVIHTFHFEAEAFFTTSKGHFLPNYFHYYFVNQLVQNSRLKIIFIF